MRALLGLAEDFLGVSVFKLALVALGGFAITTTFLVYRHSVYKEGWNDALSSVSQQNSAAASAAANVRLTVNQCFDKGGSWSVILGRCDMP